MSTRVLVIGWDPTAFPQWDPTPVLEGLAAGRADFAAAGIEVVDCLVPPDDSMFDQMSRALRSGTWDCVVIGGAIRKNEDLIEVFERVVNLVRREAPGAAIAFNSAPSDTCAAARRALRLDGSAGPDGLPG